MLEGLVARFPGVTAAVWMQRLQSGDVVDDHSRAITPDARYEPGRRLYYFRALAAEPRIPFAAEVLWQDAHLLVVDKPHF